MTDWKARTEGWVEAGLLEPGQRDGILADLAADPPASSPAPSGPRGPFADALVATIVTTGAWLLAGSLVVAMAVAGVKEPLASGVVLAVMALQGVVAVALRFALGRPVAEGLWAAALPVITLALASMLSMPFDERSAWLAFALAVPAVVGSVVAIADRMGVLAFTSGVAALIPIGLQLAVAPRGYAELLIVASLGWILLVGLLTALSRDRFGLLGVQVPIAAVAGVSAILAHSAWLRIDVSHALAWESAAALVVYGALTLVAGALARSWWFLVAGGATLAVAELTVLVAVGDALIGTVVLGAEGMVVLTAVIAFVVVRARQSTDGPPSVV